MSRRMTLLFAGLVAAQVIGLAVFAGMHQIALSSGQEVVLQTAPVDPRSLLQGDYAILDYEIAERHSYLRDRPVGTTIYVILEECGEVWCGTEQSTRRPEYPEVFIRGEVNDRGRLDFGIGTYFVPEGTGHIIERAEDVKVAVALDSSGNAVIKEVLVDGEPFGSLVR